MKVTQSQKILVDSYLFIRWDGKCIIGSKGKKIYGVYNVHGHKSEIELIPYAKEIERSLWSVLIEENKIVLTLLNSDEEVKRQFNRIDEFPNY